MKLLVRSPGILTTVQDLGRWGHQAIGMPVAGAMDPMALRRGNIMVHNDPGAAALEITVVGPKLAVQGSGIVTLAGGDLGMMVNGTHVQPWTTVAVKDGDVVSFSGMKDGLCRGYLCVAGGIDIPPLMGSRSTYLRGKIGGLQGRALKAGDELETGSPYILGERCVGFVCPEDLRPDYSPSRRMDVVPGPQDDLFTDEGIKTFLSEEYVVSAAADRMGYRMEGPTIEHVDGADIVSDAICLGAVQVPGHGQPIVMMADRQTTGGYTKIAVLTANSVARLAQRLPGEPVRFSAMSQDQAIIEAREERGRLESLRLALEGWIADPARDEKELVEPATEGQCRITVDGETYEVEWEKI